MWQCRFAPANSSKMVNVTNPGRARISAIGLVTMTVLHAFPRGKMSGNKVLQRIGKSEKLARLNAEAAPDLRRDA
jgi:hypothetical protein